MVGKGRVTPDTHFPVGDPQSSLRFPTRNPTTVSPPSCATPDLHSNEDGVRHLRRIGRAGKLGGSSRGEDTVLYTLED